MMSCRELAERSTRGEFENVSFFWKLLIRMHVAMCCHCEHYGKQLAQIAQAVREKANRSVDPARLEVFKKRLSSRLIQ